MDKRKDLSILVVDDHTLFRKGTMMLVNSFIEVAHVEEAKNGRDALSKLKEKYFDVVLLDLEMPVVDGWEASKKILVSYPDVKIIMISMHDSIEIISDLIEIGVHSYLLKNADPAEVHRAITSVMNNDFYYNHLVSRALEKSKKRTKNISPMPVKADISPRETEILQLMCQEMTMKEIGDALFLSQQTIHTHRKNLMKKIKAKNAVGLIKYAIQNGIVRF